MKIQSLYMYFEKCLYILYTWETSVIIIIKEKREEIVC